MAEKTPVSTNHFSKNIVMVICAIVVVVAVAAAVYFYLQYWQAQQLLKNPTLAAQQQTSQLIAQVGKLIDLPNETPTVATVSDVSKLKDQPFFADAQNGDKVLIYTNARKAILYRPSENKIIDVAPVNLGSTVSVTPSVSPKTPIKPTVTPTPTQAVTPTSTK